MKKIMILMLIIVAGLSACKKDQTTTSQSTTVASLPLKASNYIDNNYPDASIDYVVMLSNSAARYVVTLNTTEKVAFNTIGDYLGNGQDFENDHHGDTICGDTTHGHGGHGGHGHHGGGHHGGGHHGGNPGGHGIPLDSLNSLIKDYLTANYSGYTIRHAEVDTICPNGAVTEVMISLLNAEPKKLIFDASYNFLLLAQRIKYTDVPQVVKDYITANYSGYEVCDRGEQYTMADSSLQYTVYMHQGTTRKYARLLADGTLVCEQ